MPGRAARPFSQEMRTSSPMPSWSRLWKGSSSRIFFPTYSGRKLPASSRLKPKPIWVRSLVPKLKNSASSAIWSEVMAARGISIMVPMGQLNAVPRS